MSILRSINLFVKKLVHPGAFHSFCTIGPAVNTEDMSIRQTKNRIVWLDMEMTGLSVNNNRILEVGCLITDENLNIISDEFHKVLHQPESELEKMDEWCQKHHGDSGLTEASRKSTETEHTVDISLLNFMSEYIPKGKCPMAGNSVHMDRLFLQKYMPKSNEYMHYRIIDVSSIFEVVERWNPDINSSLPAKAKCHRAISDIKESILQLDFYRKNIFNNK